MVLAVAALSISAQSQTEQKKNTVQRRAPELKLRTIPSKEIYALHEKVFTQTEFVNLTTKTLCFPVPNPECGDTNSGSVITTGDAVATGQRDIFICHLDGGGVPSEKLLTEIEEHWIKIAPNAAHTTTTAEAHVILSELGRWQLKATYNPPEAAFGDAAKYRAYLQSGAEKYGCTVPESVVTSKPVMIDVVLPEQKPSVK